MQSHTKSQVQIGDQGVTQGMTSTALGSPSSCSPAAPVSGTDPKVGGSKAVRGGHVGGGGGVRIVGIDVGKQGAHDGGHPRTHVLGGEAGKVAGGREWEKLGLASSQDRQ